VYLLDTDVLIDIQRGYAPALTWFTTLTELPAVPGFVVMELIQDAQNAHQVRQSLKLVVPLPVLSGRQPPIVNALCLTSSPIICRITWACGWPDCRMCH
jgi:hypothetical protein